MAGLPVVSGDEAIRAFERLGYERVRQAGSHVRLIHPAGTPRGPLSIPRKRELGKGLLRQLIRVSGFTVEEFRGALR